MNNTLKVKYQKWWHRFIPRYRKAIKFMNFIIEKEWHNGMKEEHFEMMKNSIINGSIYKATNEEEK